MWGNVGRAVRGGGGHESCALCQAAMLLPASPVPHLYLACSAGLPCDGCGLCGTSAWPDRSGLCVTCVTWQVRPLEEQFKFGHFFSPLLNESDFDAKPSVLLLGQYSTGECGGGGGRCV